MRPLLHLTIALAWATPLVAQTVDSLPPGVSAATIADGKKIYAGPGLCSACHGPQAKGVSGLGPNLTDTEWLHSDGNFDSLVAQVAAGVPAAKSKSGVAMPAKGGGPLTDAQVKAVAAYVWSLSRGGAK